ncbi:23S rRNA (adenine(2503)-C(2))-methyltransferase RlmN [Motilibacter deserti]|uniref:Probable dual-specificity RNA methyltransferase RlmN n=1 Tax=Motilibacter deserti TaxID=2714956 RepID=A0ABX0GV05_9ACTN|nr:23S rRNA (adenine(2503)-C(2))-methyltransferase RlmN [Motilibacter deserti]NHC13560.1 23S rRNA (adenine(2503)-C(2))-methyltransferase RlmN [Motilibacter deserti]
MSSSDNAPPADAAASAAPAAAPTPPPTPTPTRPQPPGLVLAAPRRGKPPRHLSDLTPEERRAAVVELGEPAYRAKQLSTHWFGRLVDDPAAMPDLPKPVRTKLAEALLPQLLTPVREWETDGGATRKQLWRLHDGALVEAVLMRYGARVTGEVSGGLITGLGDESAYDEAGGDDAAGARRSRVTMCVSSQAGCGMACPFCATGQQGLTRNLSTAEIVEQVLAGARALERGHVAGGPGRVSNVVFMGMGEPLANYNAVVGAVRRLTDPAPDGLGMSRRGITVSTVGLAPAIRRLAGEGLPVTLAVSLHAPDDELRDTLVPINTRYKVDEVLDAAWHYADTTSRRVSIEYALIRDVNDQAWRADLLGRKLKGHLVHVNLIPLNPTPGSKWTASRERDERAFVRALEHHGVPVTVRDTRGREIEGACGQLAAADAAGPAPAAAGTDV